MEPKSNEEWMNKMKTLIGTWLLISKVPTAFNDANKIIVWVFLLCHRYRVVVVLWWDQKTETTVGIESLSGGLRTVRRKNEDDKRDVVQIMMNSKGCNAWQTAPTRRD